MTQWAKGEWKCGYEVIIERDGIRETIKNGYPLHNAHAYEMIGRIMERTLRQRNTKVISARVIIEDVEPY